jgi:hypothetical protein
VSILAVLFATQGYTKSMTPNDIRMVLQHIVSNPQMTQKGLEQFLFAKGLTRPDLINSMLNAMTSPAEAFGLTGEQLVIIADVLGSSPLSKEVYRRLSPAKQEERPDLNEAGAAPATGPSGSFTSTANTAPYPIPLGYVRRSRERKKKKKKSS